MKILYSFLILVLLCSCNNTPKSSKTKDSSPKVETKSQAQPKPVTQTQPQPQRQTKTYSSVRKINMENKNTGNTISIPLGDYSSKIDQSKMTFSSEHERTMAIQTMDQTKISMNFLTDERMVITVEAQGNPIVDTTQYFMRNDSLFVTRSDGMQPSYSVTQTGDDEFTLQNMMNLQLIISKK